MDLMNGYINRGQFGKFVTSFLEAEYERRKEETEKDEDWKLWEMYIHSLPYIEEDVSFFDWKKRVLGNTESNGKRKTSRDNDLTDDGINAIITDLFSE